MAVLGLRSRGFKMVRLRLGRFYELLPLSWTLHFVHVLHSSLYNIFFTKICLGVLVWYYLLVYNANLKICHVPRGTINKNMYFAGGH